MRRLVATVVTLVSISALPPDRTAPPVYALECVLYPLEQHVVEASVILTGNVTGAPIIPPVDPQSPDQLDHRLYIDVSVDEYLRGNGPAELRFSTSRRARFLDGQLGIDFQEDSLLDEKSAGKRYVLFLPDSADAPSDPGSCGGSAELTGPSGDEHLQRIRAILAANVGLPAGGGRPGPEDPTAAVALTGAGILISAAGAFAFRRLAR